MASRARLDHDLIYRGAEEVEELGADDVPAPDAAIRPGVYRWQPATVDGGGKEIEAGHWVPLSPKQARAAQGEITLERAFYEQVRQIHAQDQASVPEAVLAWCRQYEGSVDALGEKAQFFRALSVKGVSNA